MLLQQFEATETQVSDITSKISLAGLGLELNAKGSSKFDDTLVLDTIKLVKKLKKSQSVQDISSVQKLDTSGFYSDKSMWHNGLVQWHLVFHAASKIETEPLKMAYCVLKRSGNSLIFLLGSPLNVIGHQKQATSEQFLSGDTTNDLTFSAIYQIVAAYTESDEISSHQKPVFEPNIDKEFESHFSLDLGMLCIQETNKLPATPIDILFKVYRQYDIRKNIVNLGKKISKMEKSLNRDYFERKFRSYEMLMKYRYLYLGSPIYTSII